MSETAQTVKSGNWSVALGGSLLRSLTCLTHLKSKWPCFQLKWPWIVSEHKIQQYC